MGPTVFNSFLDELQARTAINDVLTHFSRAVDRGDWALLRRCLHDDAVVTHGPFSGGADEFVAWVGPFHDGVEYCQHVDTNVTIDFVSPTEAVVEAYVLAFYAYGPTGRNPGGTAAADGSSGMRMQLLNRYVDRFTPRDGEWRIAEHTFLHVDRKTEVLTEPMVAPPGYLVSQRGSDDFLYRLGARLGADLFAFRDPSRA